MNLIPTKLNQNKLLFSFLLLTTFSFSQVTIKRQGFEGTASDNLNYTTTASNVAVSNTTAMSGSNSLRFTGTTNSSTEAVFSTIDLNGYSSVQVSIAFAATGVDDNEDLFIDFSYDNGATYTTTTQLIDGNTGSGGQNLNFGTGDSAPGQSANPYVFNVASTSTSLKIRVRSWNLDSNEYFYIDNVVVTGIEKTEINLQGGSPLTTIANGSTTISTSINTNFGSTDVTSGLVTKTFTVQNLGLLNLSIYSVYTNSGDFSASISSTTIAPGGTATLTVEFNPTNAGTRNGTVYLSNNDSDESTYGFAVEGIGTEQEINVQGGSPALDIASGSTLISSTINTDFGTASGTKTYTIQNTGTSNLSLYSAWSSLTDYTVSFSSATVAPGSSATLTVVFVPTTSGTRTATISISNNDSNEGTYSFNVSATIADKEINLIGNGNNINSGSTSISSTINTDFGTVAMGSGTISKTYTIQNTGGIALNIWSTYTSNSEFTVSSSASSIAAGGTATLTVVYNPTTVGTRTATISISNDDSNEGTYSFNVQAVCVNREINVTGNSNAIADGSTTTSTSNWTDFGSIDVTSGTQTRTFTIYNLGTTALTISNPTISGTGAADFTITTNPASLTLAGGSNTSFVVTFNPSAVGVRSATISINNNDLDENPYDFSIQGTGISQEINVQGNSTNIADGSVTISTTNHTDFGSVDTTSGTISRTYTVQNLGTNTLTLSNPTITGTNAADFTVTTNPAALTIAAGASTSFVVTFNPSATGNRIATINIVNNDTDENPYDFAIQGLGIIDNDGDGIDVSVDTDDDNDGITDIIECSTCLSDPFVNGSFENPTIAASSYSILATSSVAGWQTSAEDFIEIWSSGFNGVPSASGNQFAELNANVPGILYQSFCLNGAGGTINWSIKHRGRSGSDQAFVKFGPTLTAAVASSPVVEMIDGNTAWGTYSGVYNIPAGQTQVFITLQAGYTASGSQSVGNFIDDVQITINQNCLDTDGDGIANINDLDSDNDGISDIEEAGFKAYSNQTSTMDKSSSTTWVDANANGMNDAIDAMIAAGTYIIPDTDGDGIRNHLDLDSDNDSLFDVDEAGLANGDGDINGDGKGDGADTDADGILNLYDNSTGYGTTARAYAQDTDANGVADFLQVDSNNDGTKDIQTGLYSSLDANNDGKIDGTTDADHDGIVDGFDTNTTTFGSPRDLNRKLLLEFDGRNDYAEATGLLGGLSNATLMAWIDLGSGYNSDGVIVGQDRFQLRVSSAKKFEAYINGTTVTYNFALNTSQWYHVAATYGNGSLKLYLNGKLVVTQAISGSIAADATKLTLGRNPQGSSRYFKGKMDEVRVFNLTLTDTQVQRMVYQEIQNTGSQVRGTVIPKDISSLPFANLLRYYRMDTFKDDIIDDLTTTTVDSGTGMKMYNHKNIYVQQAPMPFVTKSTGTFATAVNDAANDIRGLDVIDQDYSIIQVQHNITETNNITGIGMIVNPGVTVTMNNDTKIQNDWYLKLDGKLDLTDKAQLVQTTNSELDATSTGYIERDQQGQANKFNYNYWSSPVSSINNTTINHGFTVADVMKDGTTATPQNINWTTGINGSATSPITLSSYWIFKFQNLNSSYANWAAVGQNGTLLAGQGFTMKGAGVAGSNQNYTFVGKPNNGTITSVVSANNLNLCGNPYPSAIDADQFIDDNAGVITGTLFFWEHYGSNATHNTIQYQGGYATYTKVGGTAPVAPSGVSGMGSSSKAAKRFIPVGQGFFVTGSTSGGNITFNNGQRLFIKETNASSYALYRAQNPTTTTSTTNTEDTFVEEQYAKLRLGYVSGDNFHRQILLGFMNQHATPAYDNGYDGISIETLTNDMYFLLSDGTRLNIQGDGFFNANAVYPLGVKNATAGNVKFTIDHKENFEDNQDIFIYDNATNEYHSIKSDDFVINLPAGNYDARFSLRFTNPSALGTNENELQNGIAITHTQSDNMINITNELQEATIKSVALYNLMGQQVTSWSIENDNQTAIHLPVNQFSTGGYIVKITTDKGDLSKKILIK